MGNITSLYLSDEAKVILDEKKKKDPDFNVSRFVEISLMNEKIKSIDPAEIQLEITQRKAVITNLKNEVEFLEEKYRKVTLEIENKKREEQEKIMKQQKKSEERIKDFMDSFMTFYGMDIAKARSLAEEFLPIWEKDRITLLQFMEGRGYKEKQK